MLLANIIDFRYCKRHHKKWLVFSNPQNYRGGIAPTRNCTHLLKKYYFFLCIKLNFFHTIFLSIFIPLVDIIGIKTDPGDHVSNFKKVGAIACGCNTKWTPQNNNIGNQRENFLFTHYLLIIKNVWYTSRLLVK